MNRNKISILILWLTVILFIFAQCRKDASVPVIDNPSGNNTGTTVIPAATEVNNFVWGSMHDVYLWNNQVPNLTNPNYQPLTTTSPNYKSHVDSLNAFLNKYTDPGALFNTLLYQYGTVDKWSFIVSDYTIIQNWIAGISTTVGYDYQLYKLNSTSDAVFGVIRYVFPGSPADLAGLKRGNIFIQMNGTQLTTSNYQTLIALNSFTLTLATFSNGNTTLTASNTTPVITAVQMQEDPVYLSKVLTVNGAKIGYLVYNGFNSDYDLELNTAIQQLKTAGITKLILDLRYNGGGSVQSAIYLASMIYSTNTSKVFTKSIWNSNYTSYNGSDSFTDKIVSSPTSSTAINSLNLSDIYFIVSGETASASELLINGLKPYMNTRLIGTNTYGKYVASVTLYDYAVDSKGNLIPDGQGDYVKVSSHKYAMQPIVAKYSNSLGVSDFVTGLAPDIAAKEDVGNLLPLGDENETLLKVVLDNIIAGKSLSLPKPTALANSNLLFSLKDKNHFGHDMFVNPHKLGRTK
jgi:carboxyl-terminal processing protease